MTLDELREQVEHDAFVRYCEGSECDMRWAYLDDVSKCADVLAPMYADAYKRAFAHRNALVHLPNYAS